MTAQELYRAGAALLKRDPEAAIESLSKCVQVDLKACLCYRALGIAHALSGRRSKAMRYYRLYLKNCPGAPDAKDVEEILERPGG